MANVPPPAVPPAAPAEIVLPAGTPLSRIHSVSFGGTELNPTLADSHWGGGRFDGTETDPYPYLYAASDDECAVCEALLRELPLKPGGGRLLPRSAIAGRVLSRLVSAKDVSLVTLCSGKDLARLGQGDSWLVSCPASQYGYTRRWAQAIRRWSPAAQGLIWPSRRDPAKRSYLFFGDRLSAGLQEADGGWMSEEGGLPLDSGMGERYLLEILEEYRVTLPP